MNHLRMTVLRIRQIVLEAEVANGEALMRNHAERLAVAKAALEDVERRITVEKMRGNPHSLLSQAIRRHG